MNHSSRHRSRVLLAVITLIALVVTACGDDSSDEPEAEDTVETTEAAAAVDDTADEAAWPLEIEHAYGTTTIEDQPERVTSASVSMTGHLLAVEAPVVASMATRPSNIADENGFFIQWADVAIDLGVEPISGPELNFEAIAASEPLIVGSAVGGDAVSEEAYALLSDIAPTIVIDHSASSWEEITALLGEAVGHQDEAAAALDTFDDLVAEVAQTTDTTYEVVALVFNPDGMNVFTSESAHGQLLESLGYTLHELPEGSTDDPANVSNGGRSDIVGISVENASTAFGDSTLFFVSADQAAVDGYGTDVSVLGALPAFVDGRAHALGFSSFRLDYFSATDVVELIREISAG